MNRSLVTWLVVVSGVLASGCAADELEGRDAAYPEAVGYTPPNARRAEYVPPSRTGQVAAQPAEAAPPAADDNNEEGAAEGSLPAELEADGPSNSEASNPDGYADADPSALQDFRPALDPYGTWTDDPTYGTVWVPSPSVVGDDFTPYATAGHWAYDNDYVWVSEYDWGWAPFHYGRWAYAGGVGWEWIPGRTYAGAWVSWRYGAAGWDYVGWAPLAPTWCWHRGEAVGLGFVPRAPYAFVGTHDLFEPSLRGRLVAGPSVATIAANTRPWVRATPTVVGGPSPRLGLRGPPPAALNLSSAALPRPAADDRGLAQARAFARPATAVARGARGPMLGGAATWQAERWRGASTASAGGRAEASPPSHFGGRFGAGFAGSPAAARPPVYAPSAVPVYSRGAVASRAEFPVRSIPARGAFDGNGAGAPAYRAPYGGAPAYRAPSYGGAPVYRGAYGGVSQPAVAVAPASAPPASPPASSGARPSFGNYSGGGAVHPGGGFSGGGFPQGGGGGGGGFHGGGGGGFHGGGGRR